MPTVQVISHGPSLSGVRPSARREPLEAWSFNPPVAQGDDGESWQPTLASLIEFATREHVEKLKLPRTTTVRAPKTPESLEAGIVNGRIAWRSSPLGRRKQNAEQAVAFAWEAFASGHFLVFVDEKPYFDLDQRVTVLSDSVIVFVRTTRIRSGPPTP